jgi:predicted nucleic acid-binding Zn ribbon protein
MISNRVGACSTVVGAAPPLHCVRCGQPIKQKRKTAIYCSSNCREKASNLRAAQRNRKRSSQPKTDHSDQAGKPCAADKYHGQLTDGVGMGV